MKKHAMVVCALVGAAGMVGASNANTIEFRIVELTGQTQASPVDNVLDYAIQARVSGAGLAVWGFDCLRLVGEAESASTLQTIRTSNGDGTYYAGPSSLNAAIGLGGLARSYSRLALINGNFNGLLNVSAGTFTNTADNELGLISGTLGGSPLMQTPGVDSDFDGRPDTIATPLTLGTLDPSIMSSYMAQDGFIDVYRFRVTVTDFTLRTIPITLVGGDARSFTQVSFNGTEWGPVVHAPGEDLIITGGSFEVIPAPASVALLGLGGLVGARRRRA